jgi:hypothetical protein
MTSGGEAAGITPDVICAIGADTGIRFRFVLSSSTQDVYTGHQRRKADTVMAVSYDYLWADSHDLLVTQPYVSGSVMRVSQDGGQTPAPWPSSRTAIWPAAGPPGLSRSSGAGNTHLRRVHGRRARGEADCTFLNYYQASYYRSMSAYGDFSYQPDENITQGISLGVTKESNPRCSASSPSRCSTSRAGKVQGILSENAVTTEPYFPSACCCGAIPCRWRC